jgi:hypothetical protein
MNNCVATLIFLNTFINNYFANTFSDLSPEETIYHPTQISLLINPKKDWPSYTECLSYILFFRYNNIAYAKNNENEFEKKKYSWFGQSAPDNLAMPKGLSFTKLKESIVEHTAWAEFPDADKLRKEALAEGHTEENLPIEVWYAVLGLQPSATKDEISAAYKSLALIWHPDKRGNDPYATEVFQIINEAKEQTSKK